MRSNIVRTIANTGFVAQYRGEGDGVIDVGRGFGIFSALPTMFTRREIQGSYNEHERRGGLHPRQLEATFSDGAGAGYKKQCA